MLTEREKATICHAWHELNSVRARDGSTPGVCEEWFSKMVDELDAVIQKLTGHRAHCNPLLYKPRTDEPAEAEAGKLTVDDDLLKCRCDGSGYIKFAAGRTQGQVPCICGKAEPEAAEGDERKELVRFKVGDSIPKDAKFIRHERMAVGTQKIKVEGDTYGGETHWYDETITTYDDFYLYEVVK